MRKIFAILLVVIIVGACTKKETIQPPEATFLGSSACQVCHQETYTKFMNSGHPWKLNKVADVLAAGGPAAYYPSHVSPFWLQPNAGPPPGKSWEDFVYIIGGFGWKARFIRTDGYIFTGDEAQYNFETDEWVAYHSGEEKPYNCGGCHTTGYVPEGNQDGLEGIEGTWALPGIQCEECHGPGSLHADDPYDVEMKVPVDQWEACGRCHSRGDPYIIDAKNGFIKHHEQYEEIIATKKVVMNCTDCHDPHASAHYFPEQAIRVQCEVCHFEKAQEYESNNLGGMYDAGVTCVDCHMPYAAKSAVKRGDYKGDIRSHLFAINIDSTASMFDSAGTRALGYLTLEYTCLYCHTDETKSWAAQNAPGVHGEPPQMD